MNRKNNKGFTLIELLAVVAILAIVFVIAYTQISNKVSKSKMNTLKVNADRYVKAVNDMASMSVREEVMYDNGTYMVSELDSNSKVKVTGTSPTGGYVVISNFEVVDACLMYENKYAVKFENAVAKTVVENGKCNLPLLPFVYAYTGDAQLFTAPQDGDYKVELWGAEGVTVNSVVQPTNGAPAEGGKGGYTSGIISLNTGDKLYIYVGGSSEHSGYNGGGSSGAGYGGGATDIRYFETTPSSSDLEWNSSLGLSSRIMVAAGGGGAASALSYENGGAAGGLTGTRGANHTSYNGGGYGGNQVSGGSLGNTSAKGATSGAFGIGGAGGAENGYGYGGAGGGGYYGGGGGSCNEGAGGGGSSYISGYTGCVAITSASSQLPKSGCTDGTTDNECSIHYSNKKFTNGIIKSGSESMPTHNGESTMVGNENDGYARITFID